MRSDKLGGASLGIFFAVLFIAGCISLGLALVNVTIPAWRAKHKFLPTTCRLVDKRIVENRTADGVVTYRPDFRIEYSVGGHEFYTWTYEMPSLVTSDRAGSQAVLDRFELGRPYPCWYDPRNPGQAVLVQGYMLLAWMVILVPASFIAIGSGGMAFIFINFGKSAERRAALAQRSAQLDPFHEPEPAGLDYPYVPAQDNLVNSPGTTLAYRLPSAPHGWHVLGLLMLALFWNGVVSIFVIIAVGSHTQGEPEWFLTFALVPLLAAGFWLAGRVIRDLLATTGVGPTIVEIDHHPLVPGRTYQLFVGQAGRLAVNSLVVALVCEEEAVYRQGTNVRVAGCRVYYKELDRHDRFVVRPEKPFSGRCRFTMPPGAMHSFKSEHNKIYWKLVVQGDMIGRAPFERAYDVNVHPRPPEGPVS